MSDTSDRSLAIPALILGLLLAAGLAVAGVQLRSGFVEGRRTERFVTVRGLSEREVKADIASWPLQFTVASPDLAAAYAKSDADMKKVMAFLAGGGFEKSEIEVGQIDVTDTQAREFGDTNVPRKFILGQVVMVHTTKVDKVAALASQLAELVKAGVILGSSRGISYHFTGVDKIKPEMLAEATKSARAAAAQFASDSGATVGQIRRATQGALSIGSLEGMSGGGEEGGGMSAEHSLKQKVRVVMTVDFFLDR